MKAEASETEVSGQTEEDDADETKAEERPSARRSQDSNGNKKWFKGSLNLHHAVTGGSVEFVRILLTSETNTDVQNSSKLAPLQFADRLSQTCASKYRGVLTVLRG